MFASREFPVECNTLTGILSCQAFSEGIKGETGGASIAINARQVYRHGTGTKLRFLAGCGEAVTVIVLPSLVPAVVVRAPCRKFSTLRVRGTSLLCC